MLLAHTYLTRAATVKMITVMFALITVLVRPVLIQSDTKAALRSANSPGVWGNVSALITHLFWEGGRKKRPTEMKSEKVTSAPWLK